MSLARSIARKQVKDWFNSNPEYKKEMDKFKMSMGSYLAWKTSGLSHDEYTAWSSTKMALGDFKEAIKSVKGEE